MKNESLHESLNRVAKSITEDEAAITSFLASLPAPGNEFEAYARLDAVMADLYKNYLTARSQHNRLRKDKGHRDPMAEVAADMKDSALSALETRLIELRQNRLVRARAETLLRAARDQKAARPMAFDEKLAALPAAAAATRRVRKEKAQDGFLWTMFLLYMLHQAVAETQRRISAAHDFAIAAMYYPARTATA